MLDSLNPPTYTTLQYSLATSCEIARGDFKNISPNLIFLMNFSYHEKPLQTIFTPFGLVTFGKCCWNYWKKFKCILTPPKRDASIEYIRSANLLGIFSKHLNTANVYKTIDL